MPYVDGAPDIADMDSDLITKEDLAARFNVTTITLDKWRWGRDGKPPMPFFRLGNQIWFSKTQIAWWLNTYQKILDPYHEDRKRRIREGMTVGRPRTRKSV